VFFGLGTGDVHRRGDGGTPSVLLPWQHFGLQSQTVKNQVCQFATLRKGTEGLAGNTNDSHIDLTLPIRLLGVDDPCLR